jgi:RNA polymerase sigma-70 factor (ECF subfamily)
MAGPRAAADAELEADELAALVKRVIAALPERPREAFLLSRRHGLSHAEVAGVMEISVSTVEKHIVRAVAELRRALAARG